MDQVFTPQFWQWVIERASWVIPSLLLGGFIGWKRKATNDDGEIRGLKAQNEFIKDKLKYVSEEGVKLEEEHKKLKVQLASNAPNKEELLATAAKVDAALIKLSKVEGPSSEDLERLVSKIRPFSGTKFDVAGGGKTDRALEYFLWMIEPALAKAGWVHIGWDVVGEETFHMPFTSQTYGLVTGVTGIEVLAAMHGDKNDAAQALVNALNEIGIPATKGYAQAKHDFNVVPILVGRMR
jgi:hypothetical protein